MTWQEVKEAFTRRWRQDVSASLSRIEVRQQEVFMLLDDLKAALADDAAQVAAVKGVAESGVALITRLEARVVDLAAQLAAGGVTAEMVQQVKDLGTALGATKDQLAAAVATDPDAQPSPTPAP